MHVRTCKYNHPRATCRLDKNQVTNVRVSGLNSVTYVPIQVRECGFPSKHLQWCNQQWTLQIKVSAAGLKQGPDVSPKAKLGQSRTHLGVNCPTVLRKS